MKFKTFALFYCLAVVTSQKLNKADVEDMILKQLLLRSKFDRAESTKYGSEYSGSGSESSGNGSKLNGSGNESSGYGSDSNGSGDGSGSGSGEESDGDCFGIGNMEKLKSISNAIHWLNDEYSNSVLEEDFTQLQYVQELIGYLIVVEEHREYAENNFLARNLRDSTTNTNNDMV